MPNLYVTQPGTRLETEAGRLVVSRDDDDVLLSVPATRVDQVVLVGRIAVTTPALHLMLDRGIGLVFLSTGGRFRGRLSVGQSGDVLTRQAQYRLLDDPDRRLRIARRFVEGKLHNLRVRCLRWNRSEANPELVRVCAELRDLQRQLVDAGNLQALMGIEGQASRRYFAAVRLRLRPPWTFERRARRPPPDPVNVLLSIAYTLLSASCIAALEAAGLDPYAGILHGVRNGRAALALDLMEEFRPVIADAVVFTVINKRMVHLTDFRPSPDGVVLTTEGWKAVARAFDDRLQTPVHVPEVQRAISYQKVLERQGRQLRRIVLGSVDDYQPYRVR